MIKYIITNGHSVVSCTLENPTLLSLEVTTEDKNSIKFDTMGEAMHMASKVNKILGGANYRALAIEI